MQNCSCFTRKQTCNREYTKHCTWSRHQLKMAAPAKVSKRHSNFRIRQFKEKRPFNIAANLTLNTMAFFVIHLIARTSRIACSDRHTYIHTDTHTRDNYCNPLCACAPRVMTKSKLIYIIIRQFFSLKMSKIVKINYSEFRPLNRNVHKPSKVVVCDLLPPSAINPV